MVTNNSVNEPTAASGKVLQGQGVGTTSAFSTATYPSTTTINQILYSSSANAVTGLSTANNGLLITSSSGVPSILADGTTNQVLIATTGSPPSWGSVPGTIDTIDGDSGSITGATVTIYANNASQTCGSTVQFVNSGATSTLNVTDVNDNTIIGKGSGNATQTQVGTTGVGYQCLSALGISGSENCAFGFSSLTALTTGSTNTAMGYRSGYQLLTGQRNIFIGDSAGGNYTGSESSNICITATGTVGESNVIRIGTTGTGTGQQSTCYIGGITSVTPSNPTPVLINSSTGQLGNVTTANSALLATNASGTYAMRALSVTRQVFTSTGTYTPTTGMIYCEIICIGGGGAGGGCITTGAGQVSVASGGGSGEYAVGNFSASTIGSSQSVTIGAAGTGASGTTGGNGGNTSVGALISADGGSGGLTTAATGSAAAAAVNGGAGGTGGTGGDYRTPGSLGLQANTYNASVAVGGNGASSQLGSGGAYQTGATGSAGTGYGSGGGGGVNGGSSASRTGGAGAKGVVIVTEYIIN